MKVGWAGRTTSTSCRTIRSVPSAHSGHHPPGCRSRQLRLARCVSPTEEARLLRHGPLPGQPQLQGDRFPVPDAPGLGVEVGGPGRGWRVPLQEAPHLPGRRLGNELVSYPADISIRGRSLSRWRSRAPRRSARWQPQRRRRQGQKVSRMPRPWNTAPTASELSTIASEWTPPNRPRPRPTEVRGSRHRSPVPGGGLPRRHDAQQHRRAQKPQAVEAKAADRQRPATTRNSTSAAACGRCSLKEPAKQKWHKAG